MKKKVLVVAAIVAIISILSVGTLAWYSDSQEKVNKFIVSSDQNGDPDFSVEVQESVDDTASDVVPTVITDTDGNPTGLQYDGILPGDFLSKEPKAVNTGAYDEYIRVTVTLVPDDAAAWAAMVPDFKLNDYLQDVDADFVFDTVSADGLTVVYYYNKILPAGEATADVFKGFNVPDVEMTTTSGVVSLDLKVKADAVQTRNIVNADDYATVALAAKAAFTVLGA
ncbi:MAG: hypothetical protein IJL83_07125 [Clostridia bacterium]|nr:hypothetical protein [Clostridia bacterium]